MIGFCAAWIAMPRLINLEGVKDNLEDVFFIGHQLMLWISCSVLIWLSCQKRRLVAYICSLIICIAWGPIVIMTAEEVSNGGYVEPNRTHEVLTEIGLARPYQSFYRAVSWTFGYD